MPGADPKVRKREIEVELQMIEAQLAGGKAFAAEVRDHLEAKRAALETELKGVNEALGAAAASSQE